MRVGSSSSLCSTTSSENDLRTSIGQNEDSVKKLRNYGKFFMTRLVQLVVQSRTNERYDLTCSATITDNWFNIRFQELGEVAAQLKRSLVNYPPDITSVTLDFFLFTKEAETLPLESWTFSFDDEKKAFEENLLFYHDLSTLLRSCALASRMTPTSRYYVKKQGPDTFVILYRIVEGPSTLELGKELKCHRVGTVTTVHGSFNVDLKYRTRMELEQRISHDSPDSESYHQVNASSSRPVFGSSPDTPSSFCEVISHLSSSPASVAASPHHLLATSPPMHGTPLLQFVTARARSRTQSTQSGNSINAESPPSEAGSSEKEAPVRKREPSGGMTIAKDMPFAGLLNMSFTGALFPLKTLTEEGTKEKEAEEAAEKEAQNAQADATEEALNVSLANTIVSDQANRQASAAASIVTSTIKDSQVFDEEKADDDLETSKDDDPEDNKDDDDSFVKILPFGAGASPSSCPNAELGELISACRTAPPIEEFEHYKESIERIKLELEEFEQSQGVFDEFVSRMKEETFDF
ncbi:unnamed protein product, partial [Mesorhabditis spiculigera]